jgi:hypothetical protein
MNLPLETWYLSAAYEPIIRRVAIVLSFAGKGCGWGWMLCCIRLELFQEGDQEKTGAIPTSHRMSPASPVAEATASRAIKGEALLQGTAHKPERYRRSLPYPALPFSRENCESEIAEDQNNNERSSQP